jgi:hypothetical protein
MLYCKGYPSDGWDGKTITNMEWEGIWKQAAVVYFTVLGVSPHLPGWTRKATASV